MNFSKCPNCTGLGNSCPNCNGSCKQPEEWVYALAFCVKCNSAMYSLDGAAMPVCDDCVGLLDGEDFE